MFEVPQIVRDKFDYAVVEGEKFYYLSERLGSSLNTFHATVLESGIQTKDGIYNKVAFRKEINTCERAKRFAIGFFCCMVFVPVMPCIALGSDSECCEVVVKDGCLNPLFGKDGFNAFVEDRQATNELLEKDYQVLGFRFTDKQSIKEYIQINRERVVTIEPYSHQYLLFQRPSGISSYIFIPYGNMDDASVYTTHDKYGNPVNSSELINTAVRHAAAYKKNLPKRVNFKARPVDPRIPLLKKVEAEKVLF